MSVSINATKIMTEGVSEMAAGGAISMDNLLSTLRGATEEQCAEMLALLSHKTTNTTVGSKKIVGRPRVAKVVSTATLPESDGDAPSMSAYRVLKEDIDTSTCLARKLAGGEDKRWKPYIFRESQCSSAIEEGCDLCKTCQRRQEKFVEDPKAGPWTGRITEEPLAWVHMLGTEWAETKKPRWAPDGVVSDAASVASAPSAASVASSKKPADAAAKKAEKAEAMAVKKAEKEAAAEVKKAEKEAAAEVKKAEKEKAAEAKKAEKEKTASTKKVATPKKPAPAKKVAPAKAATETEAADAAGELKLIDGTLYTVRSGNVYEYDEISEKAGDFVGRLTADEEIDPEGEEVESE